MSLDSGPKNLSKTPNIFHHTHHNHKQSPIKPKVRTYLHKNKNSLDINKPLIIGIGGPNFSGYWELKEGIIHKLGPK